MVQGKKHEIEGIPQTGENNERFRYKGRFCLVKKFLDVHCFRGVDDFSTLEIADHVNHAVEGIHLNFSILLEKN